VPAGTEGAYAFFQALRFRKFIKKVTKVVVRRMPKLLLDPFPLPTRIGNRFPKRKTWRALPLLRYEPGFHLSKLWALLLRMDPQKFFGGEFSLLVPFSQLRFSMVQLGNLLEKVACFFAPLHKLARLVSITQRDRIPSIR